MRIPTRSGSGRPLDQALSDGRVTEAEARTAVAAAKKAGRPAEDALRAQFLENVDRFESGAQRLVNEAVGGLASRSDDPASMKGHLTTSQVAYGRLFERGASIDDIRQGAAGDCYFLAALGSLAQQNPRAVENMIRPNDDGTVTVTFYKDGKKVPVTVDRELPNGGGQYADGTRGELWVALAEKAYARFRGSYETIGRGGSGSAAMEALTGRGGKYRGNQTSLLGTGLFKRERKPSDVYSDMEKALRSGKLVTANTPGNSDANLTNTGLVQWHLYTVTGVEERDGRKFVSLRNPWGRQEVGNDGLNEGRFSMPIEEFVKQFKGYTIQH